MPVIASFLPRGGPLAGGGLVTLSGTGFADHGLGAAAVRCRFGTALSNATAAADGKTLVCGPLPPSASARPVVVAVTLNAVDFHDAAVNYQYYGTATAMEHAQTPTF